jgi:hypothetical protein
MDLSKTQNSVRTMERGFRFEMVSSAVVTVLIVVLVVVV